MKLTPDQAETTKKLIKHGHRALSALQQAVPNDRLDAVHAQNLLGLMEMCVAEISTQLGIPTETHAEVEQRTAKLQEANQRIQDLEHQLGNAASIDQIVQAIPLLEEKFKYWWRVEGFGNVSEFTIKRHGIEATLSGYLFGKHINMFSATPVTDKEERAVWLQSLVDQGYHLAGIDPSEKSSEIELVDCDKNKELITDLISKWLPSAKIISIANRHNGRTGFVIRDIQVIVSDLRDIYRLAS